MKRLLQIAAVAVIAVLAIQPLTEGLACSLLMGRAACPMAVSQMGPDCPMGEMAQTGCIEDCCNHALPQSAVVTAIPARPKTGAAVQMLPAAIGQWHAQAAIAPRPARAALASSPPPYLLNRVFRI